MKKNAIITGTSSGFGKLIALTLARNDIQVYATMRNLGGVNQKVAQELSVIPNISVVEMDVTDSHSVNQVIQRIYSETGQIDILVNNAGGSSIGIIESHTLEDVKKQFEVNVFAPFQTIKAVLPILRKQNSGYIINVSSGLGRISVPFLGVYCSTKHALESLSEALRYELAQTSIDVTIVEPGAFPSTNLIKNLRSFGPSQPEIAQEYGDFYAQFKDVFVESMQNPHLPPKNPQVVADVILQLIQTEAKKRPLRVVADEGYTKTYDDLNEYTNQIHKATLEAMQMEHLYR
jgi:NAD(P)-dependent dehydrogenase (short-subunit alcohol dehydrogenase family)